LERAVAGVPERFDGNNVIPAKDPDWLEVRRFAREQLALSKDLRIAVWLTQAETALDGVAGLAAAVSLLRRLVDNFWDTVHPQLEADGEYIPDLRVFAFGPLSDAQGLIRVRRIWSRRSRPDGLHSVILSRLKRAGCRPMADPPWPCC
jgi:type VI secretion system protein ImpA